MESYVYADARAKLPGASIITAAPTACAARQSHAAIGTFSRRYSLTASSRNTAANMPQAAFSFVQPLKKQSRTPITLSAVCPPSNRRGTISSGRSASAVPHR